MRGQTKITINPRYAYWLAPFMAKGDVRPGLDGIAIIPRPKGCWLVATNGHVLGIAYDEKAKARKPLVWKPSDSLIKRGKIAEREDEDGQERLIAGLGENIGEPVFDLVKFLGTLKKPVAAKQLKFNPMLLATFRNVFDGRGAVLQSTGDEEAAFVTNAARPNFVGLIMPMRIDDALGWPTWLGRAPQ
jgi:hypothetical protein